MSTSSTLGGNPRLPLYPLRTFRVEADTETIIRTTSDRYWGLFYHWQRQSTLCPGKECRCPLAKLQRFWKGYAAAEEWKPIERAWLPICLEITESLELDLRDRFCRGQVWELTRAPDIGRKHQPVFGKLLEQLDPKVVPPALDLVPCLLRLYHVTKIEIGFDSPVPPRTLVKLSQGEAPRKVQESEKAAQPASKEDFAKAGEMARRLSGQMQVPEPSSNGNHKNGSPR